MATATFTSSNKTATGTWLYKRYQQDGKYHEDCEEKQTGNSGNITFSTSSLPAGAIITSAILTYTVSNGRSGSYSTSTPLYFNMSTINVNGVRITNETTSATGSQDITSTLAQYSGGTFPNISIGGVTCFPYTRNYTNSSSYNGYYGTTNWQTNGVATTLSNITLTVTYEESGDRIYYAANGSWQQCQAYYGVNGQWQKVNI